MKLKIIEVIANEVKATKIFQLSNDISAPWRMTNSLWSQIGDGFRLFFNSDYLVVGYLSLNNGRFNLSNHLIFITVFDNEDRPPPLDILDDRMRTRLGLRLSELNSGVLNELTILDTSKVKQQEEPKEEAPKEDRSLEHQFPDFHQSLESAILMARIRATGVNTWQGSVT